MVDSEDGRAGRVDEQLGVEGLGVRGQGSGFRVQGSGFEVWG